MRLSLFISILCTLQSVLSNADNLEDNHHRIVGGVDAEDGVAPFMVAVQFPNWHIACGGVIISDQWILTSGHCLNRKEPNPNEFELLVGTNSLDAGDVRYNVEKIIIHENFGKPKFANDMSLIKVQGRMKLNDKVQPIELETKFVPPGIDVKFYGWGRTGLDKPDSDKLQLLIMTTISDDDCYKEHPHAKHASHVCAFNNVGQGLCHGDAGGPLIWNEKLVGIASFVEPCARGKADGFSRISYFHDWIDKHTGLYSNWK